MICWCLRCLRSRKKEIENDDADIEMGRSIGSGNALVSERIRMLQEKQDASIMKSFAANEIENIPSITERRAVLQAAREKESNKASQQNVSKPPLHRKNSSSKALEILRTRSGRTRICSACGLQGGAFQEGEETRDGRWFHMTCFRCAVCRRSLKGIPFGNINENDDLLYCDENALTRSGLARSCLSKARQQEALRHVEIFKEAENQRLSETDVEKTRNAKVRAVELIGDDLDKIVQGMAPLCAVCGGPFGPRDKLVMQGMVKFHQDCCYRGGPTQGSERAQARILPRVALNDAPATLIFKLKPNSTSQKISKTMTFFAARLELQTNTNILIYQPDPESRAPAKRKSSRANLQSNCFIRALGPGSGTDVAPETLAIFIKPDLLRATFQWRANYLDWTITTDFVFASLPPPAPMYSSNTSSSSSDHVQEDIGEISFLSASLSVVPVPSS